MTPDTSPDALDYLAILSPLYAVAIWALRLGVVAYVLPRHRAPEAITWIVVTLVHPFIGIPLYLFFGRPIMGRAGIRRHERAHELVEAERPAVFEPDRFGAVPARHRDLARLAEHLGGRPLRTGNTLEKIDSADAFVEAVARELDAAETCAHLLFYIYLDDELTRRVTQAMKVAAGRGVDVRLVVDHIGSRSFIDARRAELEAAGVRVAIALPVRWLRGIVARVDVRNHRKLVVVDHRVAITGSHNMTHPSYGQSKYPEWKDVSVRVTGPAVDELEAVFFEDWAAETDGMPDIPAPLEPAPADPSRDACILVAPAGPGGRNQAFRDLMVSAINEANERVIMTTPYFVPDEPSLLALQLRAQAGIDVTVIIPERTNSKLVRAAARPAIESLLESGARVCLHNDGLLHAKTLTIDDSFCLVGSGNFDRRSFDLNYELNLVVFGRGPTERITALQHDYLQRTRPATLEELRSRPYSVKLWDAAASVVSPLL